MRTARFPRLCIVHSLRDVRPLCDAPALADSPCRLYSCLALDSTLKYFASISGLSRFAYVRLSLIRKSGILLFE